MPKAYPDYITPETSRKIKGMSFSALSRFLWSIYSSGYSAGFLDGLRGVKDPPKEPPANTSNDEQ